MHYPLFSQVTLAEDLPEYQLKRGAIATIVEYYPMPDGTEDGYSLEGFEVLLIRSMNEVGTFHETSLPQG